MNVYSRTPRFRSVLSPRSSSLTVVGTLALSWGLLATLPAPAAHAQTVDTVNWGADSAVDGTGTGTLAGGTITVTYSTVPAAGNAGITIADNWNASLATNGATGAGVTNQTGGVLGTLSTTSPQAQAISFSTSVTNPILFINFADATSSMNFGALSLTLLDSNNAQLAAGIVTFSGATNTSNDGFAARINGTFGPGNPLAFTYSTAGSQSGFDSVGFTISGAAAATGGAPEPGTLALLFTGTLPLAGMAARRCLRSA